MNTNTPATPLEATPPAQEVPVEPKTISGFRVGSSAAGDPLRSWATAPVPERAD